MNPHYNQNYTREEIDQLLADIRECVRNGHYTISLNYNRRENRDFIDEYNIRSDKQKEILLNIETRDFCYSVQNTHRGFEHEVLYVFAPDVSLNDAEDHPVIISVYIKFNIIETASGNHTIVISFHPLNRPIEYMFR